MRLVEIVFEAEIKTFGLEIGEVVEIVKESIGEGDRNVFEEKGIEVIL